MCKDDAIELLHIVFPWLHCLAMDKNGDWFIYGQEPTKKKHEWAPSYPRDDHQRLLEIEDMEIDSVPWEESLTHLDPNIN